MIVPRYSRLIKVKIDKNKLTRKLIRDKGQNDSIGSSFVLKRKHVEGHWDTRDFCHLETTETGLLVGGLEDS